MTGEKVYWRMVDEKVFLQSVRLQKMLNWSFSSFGILFIDKHLYIEIDQNVIRLNQVYKIIWSSFFLLRILALHIDQFSDKTDYERSYLARSCLYTGILNIRLRNHHLAKDFLFKAKKFEKYLESDQQKKLLVALVQLQRRL